jgi:ABC-type multidrug transport system ATPase subunit
MADRIGVMDKGNLIAEGTLDALRRQAGSGHASLEDTFLALVAQDTALGRDAADTHAAAVTHDDAVA